MTELMVLLSAANVIHAVEILSKAKSIGPHRSTKRSRAYRPPSSPILIGSSSSTWVQHRILQEVLVTSTLRYHLMGLPRRSVSQLYSVICGKADAR
jgi:hypothetical protein